jgi:hypothetical protein
MRRWVAVRAWPTRQRRRRNPSCSISQSTPPKSGQAKGVGWPKRFTRNLVHIQLGYARFLRRPEGSLPRRFRLQGQRLPDELQEQRRDLRQWPNVRAGYLIQDTPGYGREERGFRILNDDNDIPTKHSFSCPSSARMSSSFIEILGDATFYGAERLPFKAPAWAPKGICSNLREENPGGL